MGVPPEAVPPEAVPPASEAFLRARLRDEPNDSTAFHQLSEIVRQLAARTRAPAAAEADASPDGVDDAVWALAEELGQSRRAWYPLTELARLSVHLDPEAAIRRLAVASDRDPSGLALARGLDVLRAAGLPAEALRLGVGRWRPRDHDPEAGRQLVLAAVEAGRITDARQHLAALSADRREPDAGTRWADLTDLLDSRSRTEHRDPVVGASVESGQRRSASRWWGWATPGWATPGWATRS